MVVHTFDSHTWEAVTGGSEYKVSLYNEFQDSQSYAVTICGELRENTKIVCSRRGSHHVAQAGLSVFSLLLWFYETRSEPIAQADFNTPIFFSDE